MLLFTGRLLLAGVAVHPYVVPVEHQRGAFMESFLIHARNVARFLQETNRTTDVDRDEVRANHYARAWENGDGRKEFQSLLDMTTSIDKRIAHTTAYRERVAIATDSKYVADVCREATIVFERFLRCLDPPAERAWFDDRTDEPMWAPFNPDRDPPASWP